MKKTVLIIVSMLLCLFGCQKDEPKEFNAGITSLEVVEDEGVWNFRVDVNDGEGKKLVFTLHTLNEDGAWESKEIHTSTLKDNTYKFGIGFTNEDKTVSDILYSTIDIYEYDDELNVLEKYNYDRYIPFNCVGYNTAAFFEGTRDLKLNEEVIVYGEYSSGDDVGEPDTNVLFNEDFVENFKYDNAEILTLKIVK